MFDLGSLTSIEIELSNYCNLACPLCSRSFVSEKKSINSHHIDIGVIQSLCHQLRSLPQEVQVSLSGVYGDPACHPNLLDIMEILTAENKIHSTMTTNGSLQSKDFWSQLGKLSAERNNFSIEFSIDGLLDTNHLYRVNSSFKKIINNAEAFIAQGGLAIWKMVVFSHNESQVKQVEQMANELGFHGFRSVHSTRFPTNTPSDHGVSPSSYILKNPLLMKSQRRQLNLGKIQCQSLNTKSLYISSEARVFPCCYLAADSKKSEYWKDYWADINVGQDHNFNSLLHHQLAHILEHSWFRGKLPQSWTNEQPNSQTCSMHCSECIITQRNRLDTTRRAGP
jgi:MoaA/NifB/PqqE/SkfB family radical SAM enzyme